MNDDKEFATRSVKYKEIQEQLDNENKKVKTKAELKKERKKREEELYLTTSLKPLRKRLTLKKSVKRVLRVILLVVVLFSFCHFLALPLYHMYLDSRPKAIIDNSIDYVFNSIDSYLELGSDKLSFNVTNSVYDITYGYSLSSDDEGYVDNVYVKSGDDRYGILNINNKNGTFKAVSNSSKYMTSSLENEPLNIRRLYSGFNYSYSDLTYLLKTKRDIIKSIIKDDYIKSSRQDLEVNGKSMKVKKNSLQLNKKNSKSFYEDYIKEIVNDKKYIGIVSKAKNMSEDEFKSYLENELLNNTKEVSFNIYTVNGSDFVGFDYEVNGFRQLYYYLVKDKFVLYMSLEEGKYIFNISGIVGKDSTEATVKCNEKKLGTITIRNNSFEKVDLDYKLNINGKNNSGSLLYELDKESKVASISINNSENGNSINSKGNISYKYNKELLEYDLDNMKKIDEASYNDELNELKNSMKYKNLDYTIYSNWNSFINDPLNYIMPIKKGN